MLKVGHFMKILEVKLVGVTRQGRGVQRKGLGGGGPQVECILLCGEAELGIDSGLLLGERDRD